MGSGDGATIGINGFGRVGRALLREAIMNPLARVTAINDPNITPEYAAYLLKHDSANPSAGKDLTIDVHEGAIVVNGMYIAVTAKPDPATIPWKVTYVVECSGLFTTQDRASGHLASGASRVVVAAPSADAPVLVPGVNLDKYNPATQVISAGCPTGNVLSYLLKHLSDKLGGIEFCSFTAVHAATAGQRVVDGTNGKDWRAARSAQNIIPYVSGATRTIGRVIPSLSNAVAGNVIHVPVQVGCALDVTIRFAKPLPGSSPKDAVKEALEQLASTPGHKDLIAVSAEKCVSGDVVTQTSTICTYDTSSAQNLGERTLKALVWYDNENGYARQLLHVVAKTSQMW